MKTIQTVKEKKAMKKKIKKNKTPPPAAVYNDLFTGNPVILGETKAQKEERKRKKILSGISSF